MSQSMGEEPVAKLTAEGEEVNTPPVRGDTQAVETTESSKKALLETMLRAAHLEARKNACKAVEEPTPEERRKGKF